MKVKIDKLGYMRIYPESELEQYALTKWLEENEQLLCETKIRIYQYYEEKSDMPDN